jgi:hypothetical protein
VRRGATCAAHSRGRGAQGVRTPTVPWSPCPRPPSASACPASTRPVSASGACPASAVRSARPVSSVRCLVSDVRCPVHASGIGASRVRVHAVRAGELVERVGAADSYTDRTGRIGVVPRCPRPERGRRRGRRVGGGWFDCRADGEQPVAREDRPSEGKRGGWPTGGRRRAGRRERAADHDLGGGSPGPGCPWADSARVCGPTAAPGQQQSPEKPSDREGNPV